MNQEALQKGGLIGLAIVTVSTGSNLIVSGNFSGGAFLVLIGFAFIFWREWLKLKAIKRSTNFKKKIKVKS